MLEKSVRFRVSEKNWMFNHWHIGTGPKKSYIDRALVLLLLCSMFLCVCSLFSVPFLAWLQQRALTDKRLLLSHLSSLSEIESKRGQSIVVHVMRPFRDWSSIWLGPLSEVFILHDPITALKSFDRSLSWTMHVKACLIYVRLAQTWTQTSDQQQT